MVPRWKWENEILKFIAGTVFGLAIGAAATAYAAQMVGEDGTLDGWSVTVNGEEVCSDPDISMGSKEIECDQ